MEYMGLILVINMWRKCIFRLNKSTAFVPAVGHFERGMLTQMPLPLWALPGSPKGKDIHSVLTEYYHGEDYVVVGLCGHKVLA